METKIMSTAQENATVEPSVGTYDVDQTLLILRGFLTDNDTMPLNLKRSDITIAGETESGAVFVSHVSISPEDTYGYSNWNDFDYYKDVSNAIQEKGTCPECVEPVVVGETV